MFLVQTAVRYLKDKDCVHNLTQNFLKCLFSSTLLIQKQVIHSCDAQEVISPATAFILLTKRSCQDNNVGIYAENHPVAVLSKK